MALLAGMAGTGLFLAASVLPGQPWGLVIVWLCLAGFFAYSWPTPFWVLPTLTLSSSAAAVAIGFINICANLAGLIGNPIMGEMKAARVEDWVCLLCLAGCYVLGAGIIAALRLPRSSSGMQKPSARSASEGAR